MNLIWEFLFVYRYLPASARRWQGGLPIDEKMNLFVLSPSTLLRAVSLSNGASVVNLILTDRNFVRKRQMKSRELARNFSHIGQQ
jgi:hypothetical protein